MKYPAMEVVKRKKRKFHPYLEKELVENFVSPAASSTSGSSEHDESSDVVKESSRAPDLEKIDLRSEGFERKLYTSMDSCFRIATIPTSEHCEDSDDLLMISAHSIHTKPIHCRKITSVTGKMPSKEELEEFFAAAEKYEQKRFIEKYNYDIVKDVPLEGKYQWVRLQSQLK